jgi:hypothetical protein
MIALKIILLLAALAGAAWGALEFMAGSMSDAPLEGEAAGKAGAITFGISVAVAIGLIVWMFF